ncbi:hypothetical protein SDC9_151587 [bioreactor metagenome]|uniref:Uncharacterized protein n=1 Tax=bioreactor metagenome TaxID=1076179 RepID=A0A645ESG8_9ZZZZ
MGKKHDGYNFFHTGRIADYLLYKGIRAKDGKIPAEGKTGDIYVYKD